MPPAATALCPQLKADKEAAIELLSECGGRWAYVQLLLDISLHRLVYHALDLRPMMSSEQCGARYGRDMHEAVEAPVLLLLQYYASYYLCASGVYAMASVTLSSLLSLCTTADAAYGLLFVDPTARHIRERVHQLQALTEAGVDINEHETTTILEI
ncbi:hypothetical protein AK812_SmicGene32674 [Symbiodinium microadriaticum]|uniref:Uncharacterized protein n=1 Tax=Symbiodinium microadriaticum TaxID=2951 RepID=A0A1Q9CTL0_SYMMI|nr:hypothetical protein AK812_SmicGene32674 [Symbiodinium microadriaticum]CAE7657987.1 unnamed protein product [Symbiodinium microadriaticum]